jgi:hypothetical protein
LGYAVRVGRFGGKPRGRILDFVGIIRSLEEFLYELVSWFIFYPRTLWRIVADPTRMTLYSDDEQDDPIARRYADALSPPLLLMLTLILCYVIETGMGLHAPHSDNPAAKVILGSAQNLLLLRAIIFSTVPLFIAARVLVRKGRVIDRSSLREPFYAQCYLASPFVMAFSLTGIFYRLPGYNIATVVLAVAGVSWFFWAETLWLARQENLSRGRAFLTAIGLVSVAVMIGMGIGALLAISLL